MLWSDGSEQLSLELGLPGEIDRSGQDTGRFLRAGGSFAVGMLFRCVCLDRKRELFPCRNPPCGAGSAFLTPRLML
jgi:hypothetical protein